MKKTLVLFLVLAGLCSFYAKAQDNAQMHLHYKDKSIKTINLSDIDSLTFTPCKQNINCGIVTDIDGNVYNTVNIGTQCWMKENLKTTKYNNGIAIPNITDNAVWAYIKTGAYCNYNNDANIPNTYGRLYNWYAVNDSSRLCPTGWHVPANTEWTILTDYLGGDSIAGGKMKEEGLTHWLSPNTGASNSNGFTALPGGFRFFLDGIYFSLGGIENFWSSTEGNAREARSCSLYSDYAGVGRYSYDKRQGFSCRCLKD